MAEGNATSAGAPNVGGALHGGRMWLVATVVTMATFMELLDTSISNVSLTHVAGSLSVDVHESTWILTSYLVSNAVVVPLSAWLSTLCGRKRFYMVCVALFTISSALCGLAPSLGWLVFFRVLQGAGGGGLAPSEQAILVDTFPAEKRAQGFAMYSLAIVAAPAIGPTLGGWITENYSWRWTFFINIPIGILSLILTWLIVPAEAGEVKTNRRSRQQHGCDAPTKGRIDALGIVLVVVAFGCLEVVLDKGQESDWFASPLIVWFSIIAGVALVGGIFWELYGAKEPVINLRLLKERNFALASFFYLMFGFILFGSIVLLPQLVQQLLGYTATLAGLVLSPGAIVIMFMAPLNAWLLKHVQAKWLLALGLAISAVSLWFVARLDLATDFRTFAWARALQGFGMGFMFIPTSQIAYSYLPRNANTQASSMTNLFRNLGGSFGIAFGATMLARRAQVHQVALSANVSELRPRSMEFLHRMTATFEQAGYSAVDAMHRAEAMVYQMVRTQAQMLSYLDAFIVFGCVAMVCVPFAVAVKRFSMKEGAAGH